MVPPYAFIFENSEKSVFVLNSQRRLPFLLSSIYSHPSIPAPIIISLVEDSAAEIPLSHELIPLHLSLGSNRQLISPLIVNDTIYIGYKQFDDEFIPIGLDKNNNNSDKIFFNDLMSLLSSWFSLSILSLSSPVSF